jgi:hypothetical protein
MLISLIASECLLFLVIYCSQELNEFNERMNFISEGINQNCKFHKWLSSSLCLPDQYDHIVILIYSFHEVSVESQNILILLSPDIREIY